TTTYTYNDGDQLTAAAGPLGTTAYAYDADGHETQAGPWTYRYNLAERLTRATNGAATVTDRYDGDGNRLTERTSDGQVTHLAWDPGFSLPQLVSRRDATGTRNWTYGNGRLSTTAAGVTSYYAPNAIGSVVGTLDAAGHVASARSYEPYGAEITGL